MDRHFKAMLEQEAAAAAGQEAPPLDSLPPDMVRAGYVMQRTGQNTRAPQDVETRDLKVDGGEGSIGARLYTPAGAPDSTPGLVYFHGGGFAIGNLETHDGHCRRLAAYSGCRVLAIDYRLAPENPFPAGHDDCLAATKWAFDHAVEIGFDPGRVGVGGCSAGGNLAASIAIDLKGDPKRRLALQMLLYPYICPETDTDSRKRMDGPLLTKAAIDWFVKCLAAEGHPEIDRVILGSRVDVSETPAAYVVTAGYDPLQDEGRDYARRLEAAGVPVRHVHYPDLPHDFYVMGDVSPAVETAAREAAEAMKAAFS